MKVKSPTARKKKPPDNICDLTLYILDGTAKSVAASKNLKRIYDQHLQGRCRISVIDLAETPELAKEGDIVAVPALIKMFPLPIRKVIGDLSNTDRVLAGLGLRA